MRRPLNSPITINQEFGKNPGLYAQFGLAGHHGVDYAATIGRPVYAPERSVVFRAGDNLTDQYTGRLATGKTIVLKGAYEHWLMHLDNILVKAGDVVQEGQLIGHSGNTGYTTGPHLHWGTRPISPDLNNGFRGFIDPWNVIQGQASPTPASTLQPHQRLLSNPTGVNQREQPHTTARIIQEWPYDQEPFNFDGFVRGGIYNGNNIWFHGARTGGYFWSGSFKGGPDTTGLPDLTNPVQPDPNFVPRDPEMVDVTAADFPAWIKFDVAIDPDETPNTNREAYEFYKQKYGQDYQYYPVEHHPHWWGSPTAGYTHDGIVNYMKEKVDLSVDFVTSANRITKFGTLAIVDYTSGPRNMYAWKSENDPLLTEDGYKTMGLLVYVVEKKNPRLRDEPQKLHKELPYQNTSCSDINVQKVRDYANKFVSGELDFNTGQPRVIQPAPAPAPAPQPQPKPDPIPVNDPPAPLPTPGNNPIRPKVKAGLIAGFVSTTLIGLMAIFGVDLPADKAEQVAVAVSGLVTMVTFLAAYFKTDGLSPKL